MPVRTARKPKITIVDDMTNNTTPEHLKYRTKLLTGRIGRKRLPGKSYAHTEGVEVTVGEWNWGHSEVYLGIHSSHVLDNGCKCEGAFEEPVTPEQLDDIVELLLALRAKARELGILTPRALPKAKSA
jgi:hypothetical protein